MRRRKSSIEPSSSLSWSVPTSRRMMLRSLAAILGKRSTKPGGMRCLCPGSMCRKKKSLLRKKAARPPIQTPRPRSKRKPRIAARCCRRFCQQGVSRMRAAARPPESPNYALTRSQPVNSPSLEQYRLRRCDCRATVARCGKLCPDSSGHRRQRSSRATLRKKPSELGRIC